MIIISGLARVRADRREEALAAAAQMVALSRAEPGCLSYGFYAALDRPDSFLLYEEWESEEALDAHYRAAHTTEFQKRLGDFLDGPTAISSYRKYVVASVEAL